MKEWSRTRFGHLEPQQTSEYRDADDKDDSVPGEDIVAALLERTLTQYPSLLPERRHELGTVFYVLDGHLFKFICLVLFDFRRGIILFIFSVGVDEHLFHSATVLQLLCRSYDFHCAVHALSERTVVIHNLDGQGSGTHEISRIVVVRCMKAKTGEVRQHVGRVA